ncbi:MAG: hypothetical protein EOP05_01690 [Proteobacteria bacterium]|nr:MAG: hypothetical protein EOP05_01690 [Pseudomonadota bacterium]
MRLYLKLLSVLYVGGAALHLLDVFGARLDFATMSPIWKVWIGYLLVADTAAAIGLWRGKPWGVNLFLLIAVSQLIAYLSFKSIFGDQQFLVIFHFVTIGTYLGLVAYSRLRTS